MINHAGRKRAKPAKADSAGFARGRLPCDWSFVYPDGNGKLGLTHRAPIQVGAHYQNSPELL
jgi:hypothetical protein